jgi:protein MAK16
LAKENERLGETLVPRLAPKIRRREDTRERKALAAAKVEKSIERVLIDRLRSGAYGDRPLNTEPAIWEKVMKGLQREGELKGDEDFDDGVLEEEDEEAEYEHEMENDGVGDVEYVSGPEGESDDEMEDFEDWMDGQSPDEGSDDESGTGSEEDDDESEDEDTAALKKTLANLKRKRPAGPPPKPKKKPTKGDKKGPKREIEYEIEREPAAREAMRV